MTGLELSRARNRLRLSIHNFGVAMGFTGTREQIKSKVHKLEAGQAPVPDHVAEAVTVMLWEARA